MAKPAAALATVATLALTPAAEAQTGIDAQENLFGATNIRAVTGHGGLTAGISRDGDLTVLSWPNPSYVDQLGYRTLNGVDAREMPRFGAPASAGMVLGLRLTVAGAEQVTWLRDRSAWTIDQGYGDAGGPNPHTRFRHDGLGLTVTLVDAIDPDVDVLVRRVEVGRDTSSDVESASLLTYANLSPQPPDSRVPKLPLADWLKDGENDFAAIWDAGENAVIHFHPAGERTYQTVLDLTGAPEVDWGPIGTALEQNDLTETEIAELAAGLDDYGTGSWMALSTVPPPDQHQVGFDRTGWCGQLEQLLANMKELPQIFPSFEPPIDPSTAEALLCSQAIEDIIAEQGWSYPADDPYEDALDGALSGADVAAGEAAEALRTPLSFTSDVASASVVLGLGESRAAALSARDAATDGGVAERAESALEDWEAALRIGGEGRVREVARRSLINLRVGTDRKSGAIVASIARQPPYALDWPRDGAFFNVMLDVSGQPELAEKRLDLYADWQRDQEVSENPLIEPAPPTDPRTGAASAYPADAWEMNYYADGETGGTFRFEIDTTAFAVWTAVAHVGWASDPEGHLRRHWETIRRGADLLAAWKDPATGLHAPAQEDDQAAYSQTLHGAITVFGALDIAARGARLLGETTAAERWESRASELREAMRASFYDEQQGVFEMTGSERLPIVASGLEPTGPTAWLVWPMTLYPLDDPQIQAQLARDHGVIEPVLDLETPGGLYYMKNTISLAMAARGALGETARETPPVLADQATPDTHHFGEVMVVVEEDGSKRPDQRVSTPHLWEGSLFYLTTLAAEDPEALRRYDEVLPPSRVLHPREDDGCGCRLAPAKTRAPLGWILALVAMVYRRRR